MRRGSKRAGNEGDQLHSTDADRGRYIGIEITPTTQTGTPNVGTALHLYDVSTASGGGSDSDNVAPGPVVNQNLKVAILLMVPVSTLSTVARQSNLAKPTWPNCTRMRTKWQV